MRTSPSLPRTIVLASLLVSLALGTLAVTASGSGGPGQEQAPTRREFDIAARRYAFEPGRIEVRQGDIVKVTFHTEDIAHSLTIDAYRIAKRANPGQPITFEFRADQPGTFPVYCNLAIDDGCRQMKGELVVLPKP